ncbi:MAG: RNA polymerase subunit sigma [Candidatus Hydrothermota bacterium]|nr:RNA polymerase sigma factor RpoD/SigA [Candidatus Hydrothermae bacterium]RKY94160.1 MAG: RNA polymerase subunit sigma [Candidatus Hydrothermae bacterium]
MTSLPFTIDERSLEIYLREISKMEPLTPEEEEELIRKAKQGDKEATEKLIYAHLKFVVNMAKRYQGYGVPLADLINEGNIGLLRALQRFDQKRKVRFLSYAIWWVRQAIMKALNEQSRLIKVSSERRAKLKKIRQKEIDLLQEMGEEPTFEEIAKELGLNPEEVKKAYKLVTTEISLDAPIYPDNEKRTLLDILDQDALPSPEEAYERNEQTTKLKEMLETLSPRDRKILSLYFGLDDGKPKTLEEIGKRMGISRERVRQLKERALKTLREKFGDQLKDLLFE